MNDRIDDLNLRAFPFGGAGAYPAELAGLDQLDQSVALAQSRPFFVAEVVSCLHGHFGQRAVGEPCEILDKLVILDGNRAAVQSTMSPIVRLRRHRPIATKQAAADRDEPVCHQLLLRLQVSSLEGADHGSHEPVVGLIGVGTFVWFS